MGRLARLSWIAVALAYGEALLGSWTRINSAGLTCPDYPLCHGRLIPAFAGGTIWEWTHRVTALALCALIVAIAAIAWKRGTHMRYVRPATAVVAALFALQVVLGAVTVRLANTPVSVVWHWGIAMALVASLAALAIFAASARSRAPSFPADASVSLVLGVTCAIAFVTMCIGAYVSSSGAGLACVALPGCAGNVVVYSDGQYVQMAHRIAAAACLLAAVAAFALAWIRRACARVRAWTTAAMALVFAQIVLGLLNVALRLPIDLREAHAANAALVFLCLVCATAFAALKSPAVQKAPSAA